MSNYSIAENTTVKSNKTIIVYVDFRQQHNETDLHEFQQLVISSGAQITSEVITMPHTVNAKFLIGSGKAQEISDLVKIHQAEVVIFSHDLSPAQERNLERLCRCRVLDRTGLILDIFAKRARSFEGKLQVELAQLTHLSTRLIRGWTHLERQKGGIGVRGGPGETQLESDRRLIRGRIKQIKKRLDKVRLQRDQARRARRKATLPVIALVGYTNAGKSTLFNALVNAEVYAADQLFATLDPTLRCLQISQVGKVIIADTVGFIRDLPHSLIDAFHATLQETKDADLLLHVIDASDPERHFHATQVYDVLQQIGADQVPCVEVFNKIDLLEHQQNQLEHDSGAKIKRVWLSAKNNLGIDLLAQAIADKLLTEMVSHKICLLPSEGRLRAKLYDLQAVVDEHIDNAGNCILTIKMKRIDYERLFVRVAKN